MARRQQIVRGERLLTAAEAARRIGTRARDFRRLYAPRFRTLVEGCVPVQARAGGCVRYRFRESALDAHIAHDLQSGNYAGDQPGLDS